MLQFFLFFVLTLGVALNNAAAEPTTNTDQTTSQQATKKQTTTQQTTKKQKAKPKKKKRQTKTDAPSVSPFRFVVGGALSVFPGFGVGHAVQGRWFKDYGWLFTAGELTTLIAANQYDDDCYEYRRMDGSSSYDSCREREKKNSNIQGYWIAAFAAFKLAEIISAWWPSRLATLQGSQERDADMFAISRDRYIAGGFLGTFVGFGVGHAVQGRWWSEGKGWIYTLTQLPIFPAIIAHTAALDKCEQRADEKEKEGGRWNCDSPSSETFVVVSGIMFAISRIIEIFDVWDIDTDFQQVVEHKKQKSLLILPYTDTRSYGLQLAFSY